MGRDKVGGIRAERVEALAACQELWAIWQVLCVTLLVTHYTDALRKATEMSGDLSARRRRQHYQRRRQFPKSSE
jgi:hypothetical protein